MSSKHASMPIPTIPTPRAPCPRSRRSRAVILDTITAISTAATALVAIVALIIAKQQLDSGRKISDESDAQESFREYLRVAIKYPDLAAGRPQAQEESRYRWFITYMLAALEKIQFSME